MWNERLKERDMLNKTIFHRRALYRSLCPWTTLAQLEELWVWRVSWHKERFQESVSCASSAQTGSWPQFTSDRDFVCAYNLTGFSGYNSSKYPYSEIVPSKYTCIKCVLKQIEFWITERLLSSYGKQTEGFSHIQQAHKSSNTCCPKYQMSQRIKLDNGIAFVPTPQNWDDNLWYWMQ